MTQACDEEVWREIDLFKSALRKMSSGDGSTESAAGNGGGGRKKHKKKSKKKSKRKSKDAGGDSDSDSDCGGGGGGGGTFYPLLSVFLERVAWRPPVRWSDSSELASW